MFESLLALFVKIDESGVATYIRESDYGFAICLTIHTFGLSFILGANSIVCMRLLGLAPSIPVKPLRALFPFMWLGLGLAIVSGLGLGIAHASTRLLNPIMGFKFVVLLFAAPVMWMMQKAVFDPKVAEGKLPANARMLAASQLFLWLTVTVAGRLIAYSATILAGRY